MATVLVTGGRAPAALDLARLLHAAGHRVLVAESLPQHLCLGSRAVARCFRVPAPNPERAGFVAALARIVRDERVDLLVPTCEEVFHVAAGRDVLDPLCEVFTPPLDQLLRLHSKLAFIRSLEARGVAVPETWELTSSEDLQGLWGRLPAGDRLVLKPVFSRFAVDVTFATVGEPLPAIAPTPARPWVAQRFIAGRARCTYGIARAGELLAHAAYDAEFTAGQGASVSFQPLAHPGLLAWVRAFVAAERFTGQLAFDFIEAPDGTLYPLECNPRATSGVHLFTPADGLDRALLGHDLPDGPLTPRPQASAVLGLAMWLYALPAVRTPERLGAWLARMGGARDAVFRWDDPLPFVSQFGVFGHLLAAGLLDGTSALAASTRDIEWNGDQAAPSAHPADRGTPQAAPSAPPADRGTPQAAPSAPQTDRSKAS